MGQEFIDSSNAFASEGIIVSPPPLASSNKG
jgi:hypothetical protein